MALPVTSAPGFAPVDRAFFERRALPRIAMDMAIDLKLAGLPAPLSGRSRDLSVGGVCVATATRFSMESLRRMTVVLPTGPLEMDVKGRWQVECVGEADVLTGVEFCSLEPGSIQALWDAVHEQTKSLTGFLRTQRHLEEFALGELMELAQLTRLREVGAGRFVYQQGMRSAEQDSLLVLLSGSVVLETCSPFKRKIVLERVGPGQLLGGAPLVTDAQLLETAVTSVDSRFLEITRAAFEALKRANAPLAFKLASLVMRSQLTRMHEGLLRVVDER